MLLSMLKSKIHDARVTDANRDYEGSLTIDQDLMDAVKMIPYEKILVANIDNGQRFETYAIAGPRGSGTICLNGATAHRGKKGDRVTIFSFCGLTAEEAPAHRPLIIRLDRSNRSVGGLRPI